ncbi:TRAP transporter substrate-binding protein DctP [Limibaculum sp. M0105]|uniref:TRAP transporter substrate-binding protein DctP n=1 Tax=Thermohalobaculum xanthum TaxID=2753746 RepID=A0A8J7M7X9_9RHOB|nr:TRAP transporter substrate-binding protein DctP [Thermohalobaculum xanthum]MBK0399547.1 TRAP transporter substrate-binding protein DctP [Thermohalobaculum xanthum]
MFLKRALLAGAVLAFAGLSSAMAETTLKLATDSGAKGSPSGDALDRWAALIEEGTNGEVQVDVFYQNELGSQAEVFDLLIAGDVDMMINWPITAYDERLGVLFTPYMVTSWEEALEAYKPGGWVNEMLVGIYADLGLKFFGPWPEGFNGIASKGKYAMTVEEAADLKIRVPAMFPMAESVQALGYQTATIDWSEVFTAIQTGVVDGDGANIIYWDYEYFRDTLDYYNQTKQQFVTGIMTMNAGSWEGLSPEQQEVVANAAVTVMEEAFRDARARDEGYIELAKKAGMTYLEPSDEELRGMAESVRAQVWPLMEERIGSEIMDTIRANASKL